MLISQPASAVAIRPDGNMIVGTCYYNGYGVHGGIVLCDSNGNFIKKLSDQCASTITIQSDGNMIVGTCYYNGYGVHGGIEKDICSDDEFAKKISKIKFFDHPKITNDVIDIQQETKQDTKIQKSLQINSRP